MSYYCFMSSFFFSSTVSCCFSSLLYVSSNEHLEWFPPKPTHQYSSAGWFLDFTSSEPVISQWICTTSSWPSTSSHCREVCVLFSLDFIVLLPSQSLQLSLSSSCGLHLLARGRTTTTSILRLWSSIFWLWIEEKRQEKYIVLCSHSGFYSGWKQIFLCSFKNNFSI